MRGKNTGRVFFQTAKQICNFGNLKMSQVNEWSSRAHTRFNQQQWKRTSLSSIHMLSEQGRTLLKKITWMNLLGHELNTVISSKGKTSDLKHFQTHVTNMTIWNAFNSL